METTYKLLVLVVALAGLAIGLRKGMLKQLMSLLGVAFGIVACRVLTPQVSDWLYHELPLWHDHFAEQVIYSVWASGLIFFVVYLFFDILGLVLSFVIGKWEVGGMGVVFGVIYRVLCNMLLISIVYNMIAVTDSDSALVKAQTAADANLIEIVMPIAPALLDNGYDKYEHLIKLEEAKSIS